MRVEETTAMTVDPSETRILLNGCWDLAHAGHFNALRQVWEIAQTQPNGRVVAGIHSNAEIARVKGGTFVYDDSEKKKMLEACRFVDATVTDVPYQPVDEKLIKNFNCDFAVHGSDAVILKDGTDMYGPVKKAGRYIEIPRSENIATTELIERILNGKKSPVGFSLSARRVLLFAQNTQIDCHKKNLYLTGHFDLFHPGHVEILKRVKDLFSDANLLVGVVSRPHIDVLTEGERMISLLSCKYVDDVVIAGSLDLNEEFVNSFKIAVLIQIGNHADFHPHLIYPPHLQVVNVDCGDISTTTDEIKNRILARTPIFVERNNRKLNRL